MVHEEAARLHLGQANGRRGHAADRRNRRRAARALAHKAVGTSPPPAAATPGKQSPFAKKSGGGRPEVQPLTGPPHGVSRGFSRLVVAAMTEEGKTLDSVHFDGAVDAAGRQLLERVRRVFIQAQSNADDRAKAAAAWPAVEADLHKATAAARQAGVPAGAGRRRQRTTSRPPPTPTSTSTAKGRARLKRMWDTRSCSTGSKHCWT